MCLFDDNTPIWDNLVIVTTKNNFLSDLYDGIDAWKDDMKAEKAALRAVIVERYNENATPIIYVIS